MPDADEMGTDGSTSGRAFSLVAEYSSYMTEADVGKKRQKNATQVAAQSRGIYNRKQMLQYHASREGKVN